MDLLKGLFQSKPNFKHPCTSGQCVEAERVCSADDDFLHLMHNRGWRPDDWRRSVLQGKIAGAAFARSLGVRTPRVLFCGSPTELPTAWPADWGEKFVCKPLAAYTAMRGVLLLQRGVDKLSGQRFRGRDDVVELFANTTTRPKASSILCEELVDGADGRPADDYKFFMFGDRVGALIVVSNRSVPQDYCGTWYNAESPAAGAQLTRIDNHGCARTREFIAARSSPYATGSMVPRCVHPPPPLAAATQTRLFAAARRLGRAAGVPFRVDMYVDAAGRPYLGEFTAASFHSDWHCAAPSRPDGTPDWCHLGRLWRAGGPGGGPALPAPPIVAKSLLHVKGAKRQCEVAREFLMAPFVGEPGT